MISSPRAVEYPVCGKPGVGPYVASPGPSRNPGTKHIPRSPSTEDTPLKHEGDPEPPLASCGGRGHRRRRHADDTHRAEMVPPFGAVACNRSTDGATPRPRRGLRDARGRHRSAAGMVGQM